MSKGCLSLFSDKRINLLLKEIFKMKKQYATPSVTIYGSVEAITKAAGSVPVKDAIILNGNPLGIETDGSSDIVIP
jgi:hypothetical protein